MPTEAPAGESAEAFIRRWLALEFQMGVTGGTEAFLRVSRGCVSCERTAAAIRGFYRRGGYVRGGRGEIERLKRLPSKEGYVVLLADLSYEPTVYRKSSGSSESRLRGGPTTRKLTLDREDGEWNMFEFTNYRTRLP
ncbi:hypothetical protein K8Z61_14655 [Nocardioides sp. TRM66260-LWL]|uniref:hypothetical protein n=1 Tax=Nocardioides sp. TRM66260-LWL TaxID=2874478 RepID=UPI001CC4BF56|nr:hypothetical protein [Nocardioides sp. TRM66260-LWL]MBZ5735732.1 hypothetical protein [Nocardioides sp. TRM66260-LWL]